MTDSRPPQTPTALDKLITADAADQLKALPGPDILVLEDPTGALTSWALEQAQERGGRVISRQTSYKSATRLYQQHRTKVEDGQLVIAGLEAGPQGPTTNHQTLGLHQLLHTSNFQGQLALGQLPKSHAALADISYDLARYQARQGSEATLLLGGNTKHMTPSFNQTLGRNFQQVRGLRGKGKHRCLLATGPNPAPQAPQPAGPLKAAGGVFSGAKPDKGGQLLATNILTHLSQEAPTGPLTLIDLGCGNGSVTLHLLKNLPTGVEISRAYATDLDADAIRTSTLNLSQDPRIHISWDDAGSRLPQNTADIITLNPPFHTGTAIDLTLISPLLDAATRLLTPGGRLYLVHNSHARYRPQIEERFEHVKQLERTPTFTILTAHTPTTQENQ